MAGVPCTWTRHVWRSRPVAGSSVSTSMYSPLALSVPSPSVSTNRNASSRPPSVATVNLAGTAGTPMAGLEVATT